MTFQDRTQAGRMLARKLGAYSGRQDTIVLGAPRGGVPVAFEVASELRLPLDVFVLRKLGVPWQEELAFGAIAEGGVRILDREIIGVAGLSAAQIEEVTRKERQELERRVKSYRGSRPALDLRGRTVILVDDGIATGSTARAAIAALREMKPARIVLAVPVAPASTCEKLREAVDELVVLESPEPFYAIGQFYLDFLPVSDHVVTGLLAQAGAAEDTGSHSERSIAMKKETDPPVKKDSCEVTVDAGEVALDGILTVPPRAVGIVLFAHGSGSSRHSPRNLFVSGVLHSRGIATLLFDLLTAEEDSRDNVTAEFRFDIPMLARRLNAATKWVELNPDTHGLPIGYFGASTGAAAALIAAGNLNDAVKAIVSRGGRPDLAASVLDQVSAPTLLIVGENDPLVIDMNRDALSLLACRESKLVIVPGATHLFEEPGALEEVAQLAADWFAEHLAPSPRPREDATIQR